MSDVARHIVDLIRHDGPLPVATYMHLCLTGHAQAYYMRADPFGAQGDFITAPEISQMFGEMVGVWCADMWMQLGKPAPFTLVELGPGRGTLMSDVLRASRVGPGFREAVRVVLVEASPALRDMQSHALSPHGVPLSWCAQVDEISTASPVILIANEFFDALPVHQWVRTAGGWRERCVGLDASGALAFGIAGDGDATAMVPEPLRSAALGTIVETSPVLARAAGQVGRLLRVASGAALMIDYGHEGPAAGETLQAVRRHAYVSVLEDPGSADITAHVDFTALRQALEGAGVRASEVVTQGDLLERLGMPARLDTLLRVANQAQAEGLRAAYRRLTSPLAMGSLFKAVSAVWPDTLRPAAFRMP